jgi:hypothetical protein
LGSFDSEISHADLAIEGLELCVHESVVFRKTFCQLLSKMYFPYKFSKVIQLQELAESVMGEYEKTEIITVRVLEKFIASLEPLEQLPTTVENVTEELSTLQIEK